MAYFGQAQFDSSARFDEAPVPPAPTKRKHTMARAKLALDKNAEQLFAYSTHLIATIALPAGAAIYATPEPTVVDFNLTHNALGTGINLIASLESALEAARANLPLLVGDHEDSIRDRAAYVDETSEGDATKIPLSGFAVAGTSGTPVGPLTAPENVTAVMSNYPGVIKTACKPKDGAKTYLTEFREHIDGTPWVQCNVGPRKSSIEDLISGKKYAFRMAAVGTAGQSPWSSEVVCMAP
jgi:hypothetical protein